MRSIRSRARWQVERRQRKGLVVDDLDRGAAAAEHDDGAESRIVGQAQDQFACLLPQYHRLHDDAGNPRLGTQRFRPRDNIGRCAAHGVGIGEIEHHAADIGFVNDVARHDLEHDGRTLREQPGSLRDGRIGIGGREGRHHRYVVGLEQPLDLDRVEPLTSVGYRSRDDFAGGVRVGRKFARHRGRHLRQRLHYLAMAHQVHEAPHRIIFGRVVGNPGAAQRLPTFWSAPTQTASTGLAARRDTVRGSLRTIPVTVAAISSAEAIAVWTFITRTASLPGSASNASSAAA